MSRKNKLNHDPERKQNQRILYAKKAQAFVWDFVIGILIFGVVIALFVKFGSGIFSNNQDEVNSMLLNAKRISNSMLGEGYPEDWTNATVKRIGLTDGAARIMDSKITTLYSMDYSRTKSILGSRYDFVAFLTNNRGELARFRLTNTTTIPAVGKPGVNSTNIYDVEDVDTLVFTERFVIYNSSMHKLTIVSWSGD